MTVWRVYLAGPEVFMRNATAVAEAMVRLCDDYGFVGVSPTDNQIDLSGYTKHEAALRIAASNESRIRGCDLMIANLTPFRGPSADVGTAYEVGFAHALGLPVFAFTNVADSLLDRTRQTAGISVSQNKPGMFEDDDQMAIEDFEGFDNLMLSGGIEGGLPVVVNDVPRDRRYSDLRGFEACLKLAAIRFGFDKKR
jgi:nucleoside 2-deoxyribosyltransferase